MNTDQVIEGIGKAAVAASSEEICFLRIDSWLTCMNKSEWAAWAQVFAVVVTLFMTYRVNLREVKRADKKSLLALDRVVFELKVILQVLENLSRNNYREDRIEYLKNLKKSSEKLPSLADASIDAILDWGDVYAKDLAGIISKIEISVVDIDSNMGQNTDFNGIRFNVDRFINRFDRHKIRKYGFKGTILEVAYEKNPLSKFLRMRKAKRFYGD